MATTITLPDSLEARLKQQATGEQSLEDVALALLHDAVASLSAPSLDEVVARIKATPPASQPVRPAAGSLADALRAEQHDPAEPAQYWEHWDARWAAAEAELRAMTLADDLREGRAA